MAEKIHFGRPDCTDIEVEAFTPICGYDEPIASSMASFDVPMPASVPPVPPNECVCFDFSSQTVATDVVPCNVAAQSWVTITQADDDCCTGRYRITPHIEIPCMPFDIGTAVVTTHIGSIGGAEFRLEKDCIGCQLVPYLDITFPVPSYTPPCFMVIGDDRTYPAAAAASTAGVKCDTVKALDASSQTQFNIRAKYKGATGEDEYTSPAEFKVTEEMIDGCTCFRISSAELNLTGIGGSFNNGGDVNRRPEDDKLVIDGAPWDNDTTWYGGGFGNVANDTRIEYVDCRGPGMRNGYTPAGLDGVLIPHVALTGSYQQMLVSGNAVSPTWTSGRYNEDTKTFTAGSGNLEMALPSGFEWHMPEVTNGPIRGVVTTFSNFVFNSSGVLSEEQEAEGGVILAPGLAVRTDNSLNASGLMTVTESGRGVTGNGLRVDAGFGLRIYGIGDGTTAGDDTDSTRQGMLEIMYGPGFYMRAANGGVLCKPIDVGGSLMLNVGDGLAVDGVAKPTSIPTGSVKIDLAGGKGLGFSNDHKLQVESGNGITFDTEGKVTVNIGAGLSFDSSGKLTVSEGEVKTVAGVGPTAGDVPKESLVTALGGSTSSTLAFGEHDHGNILSSGKMKLVEGEPSDLLVTIDAYGFITPAWSYTGQMSVPPYVTCDNVKKVLDAFNWPEENNQTLKLGRIGTDNGNAESANKLIGIAQGASTATGFGLGVEFTVSDSQLKLSGERSNSKFVATDSSGKLVTPENQPASVSAEIPAYGIPMVNSATGPDDPKLTDSGIDAPVSATNGAILVADGNKGAAWAKPGPDFAFKSDPAGVMVIDDAAGSYRGSYLITATGETRLTGDVQRSSEYNVPVTAPDATFAIIDPTASVPEFIDVLQYSTTRGAWVLNTAAVTAATTTAKKIQVLTALLATFCVRFLHIGKAGTVLGTDGSSAAFSGARNAT